MKRRGLALGALLALLAFTTGCAHLRDDESVCPEYRELRCATAPECSMDQRRGCRVCACSPGGPADPQGGRLPTMIPPDKRAPQR